MEKKLLEIVYSHPSLENKESLNNDIINMFEQIRLMRLENRKLNDQINEILKIVITK